MVTDAMLLHDTRADSRQVAALLWVTSNEPGKLVNLRLGPHIARQRVWRISRCSVNTNYRLIFILHDPDRSIGRNRHADGSASRSRAVHPVPARYQLFVGSRLSLSGIGLKRARSFGAATDLIADRWRADLWKAVIIDIVNQQSVTRRTVAVQRHRDHAILVKQQRKRPIRPTMGPSPLRTPDQNNFHRLVAKRAEARAPPGLGPPRQGGV